MLVFKILNLEVAEPNVDIICPHDRRHVVVVRIMEL
jgi:hypothetical protein